jgi:hypothetical protein
MLTKIHKNHIYLFLNLSKILGCYMGIANYKNKDSISTWGVASVRPLVSFGFVSSHESLCLLLLVIGIT